VNCEPESDGRADYVIETPLVAVWFTPEVNAIRTVRLVAFEYSSRNSQAGHIVSPNGLVMPTQTARHRSLLNLSGNCRDKLAKGVNLVIVKLGTNCVKVAALRG
jgi:hypothetical protein